MNLTESLAKHAAQSAARIPQELQQVMREGIQDIKDSQLAEKALKKGDRLPNIALPNALGNLVSVNKLLESSNLVLTFYRGGWCPYCNLALKALQEILPEIKALDATLVAITPENPDNALTTIEKNELAFEVLTDADNKVASSLNLTYKLSDELIKIYKSFSIDLASSNGTASNELPIAATFIVNKEGMVVYNYFKEDYKLRAATEDILEVLKSLK